MGIGRRRFIALSGLALAGLTIDPLKAVATNNNAYVNKKLGIMFDKPSHWGYVHVKDFGKLKDEQILGNGMEEHKEAVYEEQEDPICLITKYHEDLPEYEGLFSPTITVHVTHLSELELVLYGGFEGLMETTKLRAAELLTDFKVVKKYKPYIVEGSEFYEYDAIYLFEHVELTEPLPVELKVIKARQGNLFYDFNCHQSKARDQVADTEFQKFKESIKLI